MRLVHRRPSADHHSPQEKRNVAEERDENPCTQRDRAERAEQETITSIKIGEKANSQNDAAMEEIEEKARTERSSRKKGRCTMKEEIRET